MSTEIDEHGISKTVMAAEKVQATFPEHAGNVWINAGCQYASVQLSLTRDQAIDLANSIIEELGTETLSPTVIVTINGKSVEVEKALTYESLVALAGMKGQPSMTHYLPKGLAGILSPGESLHVRNGTRFTICHTGNA